MDDLKDLDLYNLLGVLQSATIQEVKKAYRKKALSCHPDKNPDNPKAAELFHQLSRALEILIDESARAAYDKLINAKKATLLRNQALDSRRKKLKEDLEARERQAQENASVHKKHEKTAEEKLQAEIERLRKEGSKQVEEEIELVRQEILSERNKLVIGEEESSPLYRLKVRWSSAKTDDTNGGYNHENLNKIFSKMNNDEETKVTKSTFTCHSCDKTFTLKWSLQRHFDNVHSPKESLTCNLCDYKTNKKIDLKRHSNKVHQSTSEEKQHEVLTPNIKVTKSTFTCHLCGKAFTLKHSLQVHIDNVHFQKEGLTCNLCDYKTNKKSNLKRHTNKVHQSTTEEKQYEVLTPDIKVTKSTFTCRLCDKAFTLKHSLQVHIDNVHFQKKSLQCDLCDYKTNKKSNLKKHTHNVHQNTSEEKLYEVLTPNLKVTKSTFTCHVCGKAFTLKHSLQVHIDNVHFRKESLKCDMCDYKTNIKGNLKRHRNKVHQNTSEEKQHEIRNIVLKRHIRKCPLCHFYSHTTWKDEINDHFIEIHDIPIKWEKYNFQHIEEFYNWKNKVEIDTKTSFRKYWTSLRSFNFICHRKGFYKTQGTNKRHLKVMGSCKIGGHCPSEIRGEVKANGNITVQYMPTHVGHENELKFLRLKPDDRKIIASHIRYNASHLEVLKEIRNSVSNKELQRIHFVNRQDISNIKRSFNLNAEVKRDPVDPVSITAWVEHFQCSSDTSWTQETHGNTDTTRIKEEISSQKLTNDNMDMNIDESCDQIKDKKTSLSYDQKKFLDKRLKELLKISDVMDSTAKSDRQYGDIIGLVLSHKRKGSALLEFQSSNAAVQAFQLEKGFPSNPLILEWLSGVEPPAMKQFKDMSMFDGVRKLENIVPTKSSLFPSMKQNSDSAANLFPSFSSGPDVFSKQKQSDEDYESIVLKNLRQAEEKKRISEEQDKEESQH